MYALDGAHAVPAEYLANRNALIACCFGFVSLLTFVRWRKHGHSRDRWVSVVMLALSLFYIGGMFASGSAGSQDWAEAVAWYRRCPPIRSPACCRRTAATSAWAIHVSATPAEWR